MGNYVVTRFIGMGGMATVLEGRHELFERRVAIKVMHEGATTADVPVSNFVREAESAMRIRHANVVEVYDVGRIDGQPYIVMEYLEGESLEAALAREPRMSPAQAATVLLPIAAALAAVHARGIVHRDVKPDNVVLSLDETGAVVPKLVDFGIAKSLAGGSARHTISGTPHYMSPEQMQGLQTLDARTDQYAFGVMLYQLLTGRMPYDAPSLGALLHAIDQGRVVPPRSLVPSLPEELEAIVLRAMSRDAERRFPDMRELARAIAPYAGANARRAYALELGEPLDPSGLAPLPPSPAPTLPDDVSERPTLRPAAPPPRNDETTQRTLAPRASAPQAPTPSEAGPPTTFLLLVIAALLAAALSYTATLQFLQ